MFFFSWSNRFEEFSFDKHFVAILWSFLARNSDVLCGL